MSSQFTQEYVRAELQYRAEIARRGFTPSRRRRRRLAEERRDAAAPLD